MPNVTSVDTTELPGRTISSRRIISGTQGLHIADREPLPVGVAGTLTTRTDNDTGVVTVDAGHGITDSDTVDVHWGDGSVQYGCDVTATTATTISIDSGSGDDLPSLSTGVVVTKQVSIACNFDGDNAQFVFVHVETIDDDSLSNSCHVQMQDSGDAEIWAEVLTTNGNPRKYDIAGGDTNEITGNAVTEIVASNGSATTAAQLTVYVLQDATP